ncbi:MAG: 9-O-acetyl-N-acetylneuraminate esterase, partial [Lachnospiraceae bacterium]|nr:9-O-acetyl-N-acetylneuraminate esterase [Lachnospiraceae bacterium]
EADHHTGMDVNAIAAYVADFTGGYPFLVSRICQIIDERLVPGSFADHAAAWSKQGVDCAVGLLLKEPNTLFESLTGRLHNTPELKQMLRSILFEGNPVPFNIDNDLILQMQMYGFITEDHHLVHVSNRIFETRLYNYFLTEHEVRSDALSLSAASEQNRFVNSGRLDMRLVLERFVVAFHDIYGEMTDRFPEKDGRELFLLYLRPIINGSGNYYIEAQTRTQTRTDVIVDYLGQQYIIELKIWRGPRYNTDGERQLMEYLDHFRLDTGYMVSFNFNQKKETGVKEIRIGQKTLFEATV